MSHAVANVPNSSNTTPRETASGRRDIHRIGGRDLPNLQLKAAEKALQPPGISVLKAASPQIAADQMRAAYPRARPLHERCKTVASSTAELIRAVGFDLIADPTRRFPNHYRIIHCDGVDGFSEENLRLLSAVFEDTYGC